MRAFAMKKGAELLNQAVYATQQDTDSGNYFTEKLLAEGVEATLAMYKQIVNSEFVIKDTEKNISNDIFKGKLDRVDIAEVGKEGEEKKKYIRIVDYKTGSITTSALSYYTGQKLQLQLYMSALKDEEIPAAVLYFPASLSYDDEDNAKFQMKGFLNGDKKALLCGDKQLTENAKSAYFPAALKNPAQATSIMDETTFCDFLDYSMLVASKAHEEVKDGFIAPSPYESSECHSCRYCKYGGMCRFNKDTSSSRTETGIKPKEIAEIVREKREGGAE
jgi:ATP-dependent helicase/nuclease subunit B